VTAQHLLQFRQCHLTELERGSVHEAWGRLWRHAVKIVASYCVTLSKDQIL
jgi:hypothetical protein